MNQFTKLIQNSYKTHRKVGSVITKWGAIEKSPILEKLPFLKGNKNYFAF